MSRETMTSESLSFGAALFKLRASVGITQTEIAALSHLNRGYYSQLENGRRQAPPARTVEKIGLALGLSNGNLQKLHELALRERALVRRWKIPRGEEGQLLPIRDAALLSVSATKLRRIEKILLED